MSQTTKVAPLPDKVHVHVDPIPQDEVIKSAGSIHTISSYSATSITDSSNGTSEVDRRPGGLSSKVTLLNFLKGMIGPGCLSLPLALKQGGLWTAIVLIFVFGFLNAYCMLQLVCCSQRLSRNKGQVLDYGGVAFEACKNSFKSLRKYRHVFKFMCNTVIIFLQIGICAVYYVFVSTHVQEIVEDHFDFKATTTQWSLMVFGPMALVNLIHTLKAIAYLSLFGNISMIASLIFIMQFLVRQPHVMSSLPWFTSFDGVLMATGSILYSFEGQAMVLPMENKLKKPENMVGSFGVLSQGMGLVTFVYAICGFFGYITYGDAVQGSITLNLPNTSMFYVVKGLLIFVIYTGFVIQQYVIVDMCWPALKRRLRIADDAKCVGFAAEAAFRTCLVIGELLLAILVPKLEEIIPLVGATAGMMLAFVFPSVIELLTFAPVWLEDSVKGRVNWPLWRGVARNVFLCLLGIFGLVAGLQSNIHSLIQDHEK
ncbi:Aa-trans domain-containing protein [Aphelenchoides fujianensis]|nr:Aa-trans domain-containing protein [Aphelenchoides fujianensis]